MLEQIFTKNDSAERQYGPRLRSPPAAPSQKNCGIAGGEHAGQRPGAPGTATWSTTARSPSGGRRRGSGAAVPGPGRRRQHHRHPRRGRARLLRDGQRLRFATGGGAIQRPPAVCFMSTSGSPLQIMLLIKRHLSDPTAHMPRLQRRRPRPAVRRLAGQPRRRRRPRRDVREPHPGPVPPATGGRVIQTALSTSCFRRIITIEMC